MHDSSSSSSRGTSMVIVLRCFLLQSSFELMVRFPITVIARSFLFSSPTSSTLDSEALDALSNSQLFLSPFIRGDMIQFSQRQSSLDTIFGDTRIPRVQLKCAWFELQDAHWTKDQIDEGWLCLRPYGQKHFITPQRSLEGGLSSDWSFDTWTESASLIALFLLLDDSESMILGIVMDLCCSKTWSSFASPTFKVDCIVAVEPSKATRAGEKVSELKHDKQIAYVKRNAMDQNMKVSHYETLVIRPCATLSHTKSQWMQPAPQDASSF